MEEQIKEAIKTLAKKVGKGDTPSMHTQQYAQAVLNLSHALSALRDIKEDK